MYNVIDYCSYCGSEINLEKSRDFVYFEESNEVFCNGRCLDDQRCYYDLDRHHHREWFKEYDRIIKEVRANYKSKLIKLMKDTGIPAGSKQFSDKEFCRIKIYPGFYLKSGMEYKDFEKIVKKYLRIKEVK